MAGTPRPHIFSLTVGDKKIEISRQTQPNTLANILQIFNRNGHRIEGIKKKQNVIVFVGSLWPKTVVFWFLFFSYPILWEQILLFFFDTCSYHWKKLWTKWQRWKYHLMIKNLEKEIPFSFVIIFLNDGIQGEKRWQNGWQNYIS